MAGDIPGQILPVVDEKRLADPIWYEWFAYLRRFVRNAEGAWTAFTPTVIGNIVPGPVTISDYGCRYRKVGHTVDVHYDFAMTNLNGATGYPLVSLPFTSFNNGLLSGREIAVNGSVVVIQTGAGSVTGVLVKYDNASPLFVNWRFLVTGVYEV